MWANVAVVVSARRLDSVARMRVFCRSFLQTCNSTAIWALAGRFWDSSTVGGLGGELQATSVRLRRLVHTKRLKGAVMGVLL